MAALALKRSAASAHRVELKWSGVWPGHQDFFRVPGLGFSGHLKPRSSAGGLAILR